MANPTTNYSFAMPTNTDLVKDLPADFEVFGQAVDTQMKTNADAATQKATLTTKGDIYAATGASTPARLGVGTNGQALLADSTTATGLKWDTPASGGMTLISTTSLTGASTTISSIPATYRNLQLVIQNMRPATDNDGLRFRVNSDSGTRYNFQRFSGTSNSLDFSNDYIQFISGVDNGASTGLAIINVPDYANTGTWKMFISNTAANNNATPTFVQVNDTVGYYNQTGAISSFTLFCASGNITSGTALLYGVK